MGGSSGAAVPTEERVSIISITGDGGDGPVGSHFPDPVVRTVGDEEITGCIHRYAGRVIELSGRGWATIAAKAKCSVTRHRPDDAVGGHLPNTVVTVLGDEQIAGSIYREAFGVEELSGRGNPTVSAEAGCSGARDGGDRPWSILSVQMADQHPEKKEECQQQYPDMSCSVQFPA